jgi:hypothetical protein
MDYEKGSCWKTNTATIITTAAFDGNDYHQA